MLAAARQGDMGMVECLVEAGADVNAAIDGGTTALIEAAGKGHFTVVEYLVEAGAAVSTTREVSFVSLVDYVLALHVSTHGHCTRAALRPQNRRQGRELGIESMFSTQACGLRAAGRVDTKTCCGPFDRTAWMR